MLPRLLILSLLIPTCAAPVAAQSSPDKSPFSFWTPQNGMNPPQGFRLHTPALSQTTQTPQLHQPLHWIALNFSYIPFLPPKFSSHSVTLAQNATPCYTIRSYRFAREDPKSDATDLVGYSTCQSGTEFHRKDAVDTHSR
jgi:hypothetical protein